jgi:hypothetical protein
MNKKDETMFRYRMARVIRSSNRCGNHNGCLRIWKGNTFEHEKTKFEICFKLINEGYDIYSEAIFESGYRADIVAIGYGRGIIIEVETPKSVEGMKKKMLTKENYPDEFEKILIVTDNFNLEDFKI